MTLTLDCVTCGIEGLLMSAKSNSSLGLVVKWTKLGLMTHEMAINFYISGKIYNVTEIMTKKDYKKIIDGLLTETSLFI